MPTVAEDLVAVTRAMRRVLRRRLRATRPVGVPRGGELELLILVDREPGLGVAAAAEALQLAGNSVSTLVARLVDAGMLRRDPDPADRRAVRLHVTDDAAERLRRWRADRQSLVTAALARLGDADRAAVAASLPALHRLVEELATVPEPPEEES